MPDRLISGSTDPTCIATVANNFSIVSLEEFTLKVRTGKLKKKSVYLFIVLDLLPHPSFLHIETSTVITSTSLFFCLFICSESWFIMAHRRSAQSAPSYMSEREAEGTHVGKFITLFHSVSSYMVKHVQSRIRASQTGETVQDPG